MPITVDAAGAVAIRVWLTRQAAPKAIELARTLSWTCIALSILGNAGQHGMAAYAILPPWWVIVLVASVPPAMLGAVVHLAVLMGRPADDEPVSVAGPQPEIAVPSSLEKDSRPVEVSTLATRPVAAAETRRDRVSTTVAEPGGEPDLDKLQTLRRWRDEHPGEPLSQRRVIEICKTNNSRAKTLLTALENT